MTKISFALVAALSLAAFGCKKKGPDCAAAMSHATDIAKADPMMKQMDPAMTEKLHSLSLAHCTDDKWDADVVKCFNDAKAAPDLQACSGKLKPEQSEKFNKDMMAAMAAMQPPTPPPPPPPAAGSDMGSNGSAMAPAAGSDGSGGSAMAPAAGSGGGSAMAPAADGSAAMGSGSAMAPAAK